jgi:NAD+ synthase (glutamine-hydrolysing)
MHLIKVAAGVLNQTPLDWEGNRRNILAAIAAAREAQASLLCLPELCITGYGCEDAFHGAFVHRTAWAELQEIVPATRGMIVAVGLPIFFRNALFNAVAILVDGRIAGFVAKRYLAGDGIHYEPRWFKPWPAGLRQDLEVDGTHYPFGDIFFDIGGLRIGLEICEDAWVANRPGAALALKGIDLILNPSASHFAFGKIEIRKRFVLEGSRAFGVGYIYANLLGNEAGRAIYDGGALIAAGGGLVAAGPRFSFRDYAVTTAVVDLDRARMSQARTASFSPDMGGTDEGRVPVDFTVPPTALELTPVALVLPEWETGGDVKAEEFARAEALALFDYLRKSRSGGFVVSLSGGADSAAVSVLAALAVRLGVAELGVAGFLGKLRYFDSLAKAGTEREIVARLLVCVYQATRNSSETTRHAARTVAGAVGAEFLEFEVDHFVQDYTRMVGEALGRPLTWAQDDIALQNIQARVRSPGVWLLANLRNGLLLSTSNRSEAAVGYATMDGDTSGGLAPIAGIDKAYLRRWLTWMEQTGPAGIGPLPALATVNVQPPTAELRPPDKKQTDEDDLMPYDVLDACERVAIRDKKSPAEVLQVVRTAFPRHDAEQLRTWVIRFFRLWSRNQWKRERYAPSFHLDDENLDPKTWCRFPILSSGFERELANLRQPLKP